MNQRNNICPVCKNYKFAYLEKIRISKWVLDNDLGEDVREVDLLQCLRCGHQQMDVEKYDREFFDYLYPDNAASDALISKQDMYSEIINFNSHYLNAFSEINVADFGGGKGDFLNCLHSSKEVKSDFENVFLYDFKSRKLNGEIPEIEFGQIDFNNIQAHFDYLSGNDFDYGFCIHVLEHLIDPREFLENLFLLNDSFHFYLEVPATDLLSINDSSTHLHPTHIQYFTLPNLVYLLNDIGFDVVRAENMVTSGVPRLKVLVKKGPLNEESTRRFLRQEKERYLHTFSLINEGLEEGKVALWGIGQEFRDLVHNFDDLKIPISQAEVLLVDSGLCGHCFAGSEIIHPKEICLDKSISRIVVMPKLKKTRHEILISAKNLGIDENLVLDPCLVFDQVFLPAEERQGTD